MSHFLILFFPIVLWIPGSVSQTCSECVNSGKVWCVESSNCSQSAAGSCGTLINVPLNCPTQPKIPYDENFIRTQHTLFVAASHSDNPQLCFNNQLPTMKVYQRRVVNCSSEAPDIECVGYTAYDVTQKVILISFRGAHGQDQVNQLANDFTKFGIQNYFTPETGKIFKVIYDSFMLLWTAGMQQDIRTLKYKYPGFELWVNGHSLGGVLAQTASTYLVTNGIFKSENMKVVTYGASRLGDYDFANWFTNTFPYSFNIVHSRDINTRTLPIDPHTNLRGIVCGFRAGPEENGTRKNECHRLLEFHRQRLLTALFRPRTEVWYNNYMRVGDAYEICPEADGDYCSEKVQDGLNWVDHVYYFNIMMPMWGQDGCPKNVSAYAQPGS